MALIVSPLSIQDAVTDLQKQIVAIRRKQSTLVDYYIYPNEVPSSIKAYDPRLKILQDRLSSLGKIDYPNLAYLLDDSDALAASFLNLIIDQLLNAVHGIGEIFEDHYDRTLKERRPFDVIYKVLEHRERQLKDIIHHQMNDRRKLLPEDLRPNEAGHFCRGAIQMINRRDRGGISQLKDRELLDENKLRLKRFGGAFLWWECSECTYRLRYHVTNSANASIHSTNEVRDHQGVSVEYKSTFLIKCHTYQPSTALTPRSSGFSLFGSGRDPNEVTPSSMKYGCVFCFALGKKLQRGVTAFSNGKDLAAHLALRHKKPAPASPLLQKFNVAIKDKKAEGVKRWDVNFK
jgi:hypothetical protein